MILNTYATPGERFTHGKVKDPINDHALENFRYDCSIENVYIIFTTENGHISKVRFSMNEKEYPMKYFDMVLVNSLFVMDVPLDLAKYVRKEFDLKKFPIVFTVANRNFILEKNFSAKDWLSITISAKN